MSIHCPQCDSENIQSVRMIYEGGTSNITGMSQGGGVGYTPGVGATFFTGGAGISGKHVTLTAARYAPPAKKKANIKRRILFTFLIGFTQIVIVLAFSSSPKMINIIETLLTLLFWTLAIFAIKRSASNYIYNRNILPGLYKDWEKNWVCLKCGYFGNKIVDK